jgi:hypothetical protein
VYGVTGLDLLLGSKRIFPHLKSNEEDVELPVMKIYTCRDIKRSKSAS